MKPTTLIYGISAQNGAVIDPLATQSLSVRFIPIADCTIEDVKTLNKNIPANVKATTMAVLDIGEDGVKFRVPDGAGKTEPEAIAVIEQRAAAGLSAVMELYHSVFQDIDIATAPSFTEFLETCVKDKFLVFAAEEIEEYRLKDTQVIDTEQQLRQDCVNNYIYSASTAQFGKGN